jgi:hypothetical protein
MLEPELPREDGVALFWRGGQMAPVLTPKGWAVTYHELFGQAAQDACAQLDEVCPAWRLSFALLQPRACACHVPAT